METQSLLRSIGLLILRLGIGGFMASHGWGKVQMLLDWNFEMWRDPFGVSNEASLILATFAEFLCSLLVMAGLLTRFAAVPVVIAMAVAAFKVHGGDPWTMGGGAALFSAGEAESWASKEPALLYLIPFLALIFTGPGRFSLDALIWRRGAAASE